ncbi:MAG: acetyl-CoA carboxylase biotin carboxyl carrier protein [Turicibacter sp.]
MNAKVNPMITKESKAEHGDYILELMERFSKGDMTHFNLEIEGLNICLKKEVKEIIHQIASPMHHSNVTQQLPQSTMIAPAMQAQTPSVESNQIEQTKNSSLKNSVKAPLVGTFYGSNNPGGKPFVSVGDTVKKGQVLCIIEAMKVMNEIESPFDGVITEVNVANEDAIGFDQVLMVIE